jgi:hypothetical protein
MRVVMNMSLQSTGLAIRFRKSVQPILPGAICLAGLLILIVVPSGLAIAQEDPASDTPIISETLGKIKEVENLDKYIAANAQLTEDNKVLREQIAGLTVQVQKLTQDLLIENERLRKQSLELPDFTVKARIFSSTSAMAVLQYGEKTIRIREGTRLSVPIPSGIWVLMEVQKISKDTIELRFPELERDIVIFD